MSTPVEGLASLGTGKPLKCVSRDLSDQVTSIIHQLLPHTVLRDSTLHPTSLEGSTGTFNVEEGLGGQHEANELILIDPF